MQKVNKKAKNGEFLDSSTDLAHQNIVVLPNVLKEVPARFSENIKNTGNTKI